MLKKYICNVSNVSLHVKKIKPSENSSNAFLKTLTPTNNVTPFLNYIFTSKLTRQFHLPNGQNGKYITEINLYFHYFLNMIIFKCNNTHILICFINLYLNPSKYCT